MVVAALASPTRRDSFERVAIDAYVVGIGLLAYGMCEHALRRHRATRAWLLGTALTVGAGLVGVVLFYAGRRTPAENFAVSVFGSVPTGRLPASPWALPRTPTCSAASSWSGCCSRSRCSVSPTVNVGRARPRSGSCSPSPCRPASAARSSRVALWLTLAFHDRWADPARGSSCSGSAVAGAAGFFVLAATLGPARRHVVRRVRHLHRSSVARGRTRQRPSPPRSTRAASSSTRTTRGSTWPVRPGSSACSASWS